MEHTGSTLFEQLSIWEDEKYRGLQGTYPVIFLSFSNIKESSYREARRKICRTLQLLYRRYAFLADDGFLNDREREDFDIGPTRVPTVLPESSYARAAKRLSRTLSG